MASKTSTSKDPSGPSKLLTPILETSTYETKEVVQNGKLHKPHATVPQMQIVVAVIDNNKNIFLQRTRYKDSHTFGIPSAIKYDVIDLVLL